MSLVGTTILHYSILAEIGRGGMGVVYKAHDQKLDRTVALKFIPDDQTSETHDRFLREARAASRLNHSSIVSIYAIEHADRNFIVMEYVEGSSLRRLLDDVEVGVDHALIIAKAVASALATAHNAGVVHRDIKPDNILISVDGTPKVLDFGIAKVEGSEKLTQTEATLGTVAYMSPEQSRGESVDGRSDIFSLGVILYEMIAGVQPFRGAYPAETTFRILNEEPEPLSSTRSDIPKSLQLIVTKCLQKDPTERYASADELESDLGAFLSGEQVTGGESVQTHSPTGWSGRSRFAIRPLWAIPGVVLIGLLAASLYLTSRPTDIRSIAVLPFENSSNDPDVAFLCDGIPESVINRLTYIPDFKVISRASSFSFRDHANDPPRVGEALGVRTLLLGRLQRRGDELAINAELVDTRDNSQLWGERFTRPVGEVMNIEEEIASSIAERLRLHVVQPGKGSSDHRQTDSKAYELFMKGRHLILGSQEEMENAVDYFRQATEIDPDFGEAWAGMAEGMALQAYLQYASRDELLAEAHSALNRAMAIDPESPNTLVAKTLIDLYFDWDFRSAERAARQAIEISPGLALAHQRLTEVLMAEARVEDAYESALRSLELDPIAVGANHDLGIILFMLGRFDEAAKQFQQAVEVHPTWVWGYIKGAIASASAGDRERALQLVEMANDQTDGWGSPLIRSWIAHAYARAGRRDLAQAQVDLMLERKTTERVDGISLGYALVAVGDYERAIDWIETGVRERSPDGIWLKVSGSYSLLKPIGENERFQDVVKNLDRPEQ